MPEIMGNLEGKVWSGWLVFSAVGAALKTRCGTSGCCEFAAAYSVPTYRGLLPFSA